MLHQVTGVFVSAGTVYLRSPSLQTYINSIILIKGVVIITNHNMYVFNKYSVDIYLLYTIKVRVRLCTCSLWRML